MRAIRVYHPENLNCGETTFLHADNSNHLIRVLRTKKDSSIILFNGDGFNYHCTTLDNNHKKTQLFINTKQQADNESNLNITLFQGLSRHDRMDTTIQKSVELGANKIVPVICQRSNIKTNKEKLNKKLIHWGKILISACEQSGRCTLPGIEEIILLDDIHRYIKRDSLNIILNPLSNTSIKNLDKNDSISIFIGPEGGLKDDEIALLEKNNFESANFGPRTLRTETAGPAVISSLQILWGDF